MKRRSYITLSILILSIQLQAMTIDEPMIVKKPQNKWFVSGGLGSSKVSTKDNTNANLINQAKDTKASLLELGIGRYMKNNISAELSYQTQKLEIVRFNQLLLGLNYHFKEISNTNFTPFIGVNIGISSLKWSGNPFGTSTRQDKTSSEFVYGVNLGVNYKLDDNWYFYTKYQYLKPSHKTYINNNSLNHNSLSNIVFGIKYDIK